MVRLLIISLPLYLFCAACSQSKVKSNSVNTRSLKAQGLDKFNDGYEIGQDENGFTKVKSNKQSAFEKKRAEYAKRNSTFQKKVTKDNFDLKRWQGDKKKSFAPWSKSNKSFEKPEFIKQNSQFSAKDYGRQQNETFQKSFQSQAARERNSRSFDKSQNREVEQRRRAYPEPRVVDQSQYKNSQGAGLSVDDAKRMLGN